MLLILIACVSMAARDSLGTFLTIAEARGRPVLAGVLDGLCDLATIAVTVTGAGPVLEHGLNGQSLAVIAAMVATSTAGTILWTRLGSRIEGEADVRLGAALARIIELERHLSKLENHHSPDGA